MNEDGFAELTADELAIATGGRIYETTTTIRVEGCRHRSRHRSSESRSSSSSSSGTTTNITIHFGPELT